MAERAFKMTKQRVGGGRSRPQGRKTRSRNTHLWLLVGILVISGGLLTAMISSSMVRPDKEIVAPDRGARPQAVFNRMGDPQAPVKIVEYSDYQCPYCKMYWENTEHLIVENYVKTGKVYFTARSLGNWISDGAGGGLRNYESQNAAMAAYCAGDQGKFWEYHDILYANQDGENQGTFDRKYLLDFAGELGLDNETFRSCLDGRKYAELVKQDGLDGEKDITGAPNYEGKGYGTPSFLINGKLISGSQPFTVFQREIEAALVDAER